MVAGVDPQGSECAVHVQAEAFSEFAFGLFDDDPAVQGRLQLLTDAANGLALDFYRRTGWGGTRLVALRRMLR